VAVKVQYPGITDALASDLKWVGRFARIGLMMSSTDGASLAEELRERVLEECDYASEARNQTLFHNLFAGDEHRSVPAVVKERSTRRVITSDFVDGLRFQEFLDSASPDAIDRAGVTIFRTCFRSIFRDCVLNADPHPGNYLFGANGNVTFLDFGCVKWFSPQLIEDWKGVAWSLINDDKDAFAKAMTQAGMVLKQKGFDWDYQWRAMDLLYQPFKSGEVTQYTGAFIEEANRLSLFDNPNRLKLTLPKDWLFVNRLQFGLLSILVKMGSRADWGTHFREALSLEIKPITQHGS
jgi:predicted unusual protein kinase regulating ubiquinone biosynthesis (AarF/ABC1/UbiB family)